MRGVGVDVVNRPPTWRQLKAAKLDSVRVEMRDVPEFYSYTRELENHQIDQVWLVGPSTGSVGPILDKVPAKPALVIIGNEPDLKGNSSWTMSALQYTILWNAIAPLVRATWPDMELATAGMYNKAYLDRVLSRLHPDPNYINKHYPGGIDDLRSFAEQGPPVIVGEWCWRTATEQEMTDWVHHFLDYYTWHWFYFCWADYMVPSMGLLTTSGRRTPSYHYLKGALTN